MGTSAERASNFATEKRITPTWTVSQLKSKLETMTGVPPVSQRLRLKAPGREDQWVEGEDRLVQEWGLGKGYEIEVSLQDIATSSLIPPFLSSIMASVLKGPVNRIFRSLAARTSIPVSCILAWFLPYLIH